MMKVTKEELAAMDGDSDRCALELSDARVDVLGYACLVAIMSMGHGYHRVSEQRLHGRTVENGGAAPVVTSAGALIHGLERIGAKKIAVLTPYMKPLTDAGGRLHRARRLRGARRISLEIPDNLEVGARDPRAPIEISKRLNTRQRATPSCSRPACRCLRSRRSSRSRTASACRCCRPRSARRYQMLEKLGLKTVAPNAGSLLSGSLRAAA